MTDTELIRAMRSREAELTAERNTTVADTKTGEERWNLLNACLVFLSLAADRLTELQIT